MATNVDIPHLPQKEKPMYDNEFDEFDHDMHHLHDELRDALNGDDGVALAEVMERVYALAASIRDEWRDRGQAAPIER